MYEREYVSEDIEESEGVEEEQDAEYVYAENVDAEHAEVEHVEVEHEEEHVEVEHEDPMDTEEVDKEAMQPEGFRIKHPQWMKIYKHANRCDLKKTVEYIEGVLNERELGWFTNQPQFRHYFHMPRHYNRRLMTMWMLLLREVETKKKKEVWFVVNGVPIKYSLAEHVLLSGLNCKEYPLGYEQLGNDGWVKRCFGKKKINVNVVKKKLAK